MTRLHARRRAARRSQRLARVDVGIGVVAALVLIIVSPGLAVTAIVALLVLVGCGTSVLVGRRRRMRAEPSLRNGAPARRRRRADRPRSGIPS
jgi:UPF0716 family protein affecting phage T7 exclusion